MSGRVLSGLLLALTGMWLLMSYVEFSWIPVQEGMAGWSGLFRWLFVATALLFLLIQSVLIWASARMKVGDASSEGSERKGSTVRRGQEIAWTAVPLVASLVLFIYGYCSFA